MEHCLKILPCYAYAKTAGQKMFEIRDNSDRGFQKGDYIRYRVVDSNGIPQEDNPIHSKLYRITYVTNYAQKENFVVYGEEEIV